MNLTEILSDEAVRNHEFPVTANQAYFAHAGVSPLCRAAADAITETARRASEGNQENEHSAKTVEDARSAAATLLDASPNEIALMGPTSLGLSLVARGLTWQPGDEVVYYADDYPANVYPWAALGARGVTPVALQPEVSGVITWDVVEAALTERTRLVALASCHFLSGYRIDIDTIGKHLHERGILFCLDAIQTLGAFSLSVEHVDFLSADSHKWLLGPSGAGIFYVRESLQRELTPTLLGAWNVVSPEFVAQPEINFEAGGRRYEPGALNLTGIAGLAGALEFILELGIDNIAERLLVLRTSMLTQARSLGYRLYLEEWDQNVEASNASRTAIITLTHPDHDMVAVAAKLGAAGIAISLRQNRTGDTMIRFSPHCYNTEAEISRALECLVG